MPVKLSSFSVDNVNCNTIINWKTATEENVNKFQIEKSENGINFEVIGSVIAKNSSSGFAYSFQDKTVNENSNFYRLLTIDNDGRKEFSNIIKQHGCKNNNIEIYPNPTQDVLNIAGIKTGYQIKIINALGQVVISQIATQNNTVIKVNKLPKSIYTISIFNDKTGITTNSKFYKQ